MPDSPPPAFPPSQNTVISTGTALLREYRKGNWTLQETLTLITAKRLDEQRRSRPSTSSSSPPPSKPAGELRWKWVENYCWDHGCYRSQNQCNDKWDNLLRDYKKVRNYQSQSDGSDRFLSYWSMDRATRKLHNLPTNMSAEVFTALNDVVQAKYGSSPPLLLPLPSPPSSAAAPPPQEEQRRREEVSADPTAAPPNEEAVAPPASVSGRSGSSSESESSERSQSPEPKSKKIRKIGSSIRRSAALLARTIRSCEERKDQRHREIIELEQRRVRMEESRDEVNRKGIADLVAAVANLSGAIQSLVAGRYNHT